jgi:hypothetical protein
MIRELLEEKSQDYRDGIPSLRGLNQRLTEHAAFDEKRHGELEARIRDLEKVSSRQEGVMDTGRFNVQPTTIHIEKPSKRPSGHPIAKVLFDPRTIATIISVVTLGLHALLRLLR